MAPAIRNVPASMRSGMMACSAPCSALHALDADGGRAGAFDLRAHLDQQIGQVRHLRLAGGVAQHGFALGQHGRHHQVLGAGDGDAVEVHHRAAQALGRLGFDVAVRLVDARAELLQAEDVQVDGPRADGAAAGQGNARAPAARHQRPQHQAGGAHGLHQLVGRFGRRRCAACAGATVSPSTSTFDADIHQQPLHGADVAHARNAAQRHRLFGEQRRGQRRQRRVLRAVDRDLALEGGAARNHEFIHAILPWRMSLGDAPAGSASRRSAAFAAHAGPAHHDGDAHAAAGGVQQLARRARGKRRPPAATMRRARSASLAFFGWTFTIRLP